MCLNLRVYHVWKASSNNLSFIEPYSLGSHVQAVFRRSWVAEPSPAASRYVVRSCGEAVRRRRTRAKKTVVLGAGKLKAEPKPKPTGKVKAKAKAKTLPKKRPAASAPSDKETKALKPEPEEEVETDAVEPEGPEESKEPAVARRPACRAPPKAAPPTKAPACKEIKAYKYLYHKNGIWGLKKDKVQVCTVFQLNLNVLEVANCILYHFVQLC